MKQMKATVLTGIEQLEFQERPVPVVKGVIIKEGCS